MRELVVPVCVLFVLATLLLPMPAALLDFLLVANIILALVLLISTLYVSDPIKLSAFPTILLLATLYRLALNVSTTRRILAGDQPGQMIEAFGSVVIQGNLIVGVIVFLVITLVQFIVIAKGAERVAEVAARFTLDALPGKQMSIDADMRSGLLSLQEAKLKRRDIQTESRFYGALDGAMKFVKGDAIAGIVITIINLLGGVAMGAVVLHLGVGESVSRFALFTVGDGLLSQIPALMNSLAAGILVTRVTHDEESNLAKDVLSQIGQVKTVKVLISVLAFILAFVPEMPALPFLLLSAFLGVSCLFGNSSADKNQTDDSAKKLSLDLPPLLEVVCKEQLPIENEDSNSIASEIDAIRSELFNTTGVIIPPPSINYDPDLSCSWLVKLKGVEIDSAIEDSSGLSQEAFLDSFRQILSDYSSDFIDDSLTRHLLNTHEERASEQVDFVIPDIASVTTITSIIRELVAEGVSVRSFDSIMQAIAEQEPGRSVEELLGAVRVALGRQICAEHQLFKPSSEVAQISTDIDITIASQIKDGPGLPTPVLSALLDQLAELKENSVVVCSRMSRTYLRDSCRARNLKVVVLAMEELDKRVVCRVSQILGVGLLQTEELAA